MISGKLIAELYGITGVAIQLYIRSVENLVSSIAIVKTY